MFPHHIDGKDNRTPVMQKRMSWNQGALYLGNGKTRFRIWAPGASSVQLQIITPSARNLTLAKADDGYHELVVEDVNPGTGYLYSVDGAEPRPDPASRYQPDGVHAASVVVQPSFSWSDFGWTGLRLEDYVIYELHVGTFCSDGTFDGVIEHLPYLKELGITAIELLPIAQFPGDRNWGYDGVYPYAAQASYGGPAGLKRLVDAAHQQGLAVILDVVYNHLGPEGNYLSVFAPYFTDNYKTPWGWSLNFDGPSSDEVRKYFIGNALYWIEDCHIDALRLDAVHAIVDTSAEPFLRQLTKDVHACAARLGRRVHVIAENDRNDPSFARSPALGGMGMDSQWSDDFHHALHSVLTGEQHGYYSDFGAVSQLAKAMQYGYVYDGKYSPHRNRLHGASSADLEGKRFVVCAQNHDQVGNRMLGDRLSVLVDFPRLKLAAAAVLLSPNIPLLFMGEEYGESAPFLYFVSHGDADLIKGVREGRREEFAAFHAKGTAPDPQSEETFRQSKLNCELRNSEPNKILLEWYRELLRLRREIPALAGLNKQATMAVASEKSRTLVVTRSDGGNQQVIAGFNFSDNRQHVHLPITEGKWQILLNSADPEWKGDGEGGEPEITEVIHLPPTSVIVLINAS